VKHKFKPLLLFLLTAVLFAAALPAEAKGDVPKRPTVLLILDGFGLSDQTEHNAVALADTPVLDRLMKECPFVEGAASGLAVGLPEGQMGSSEVGHLNIGAGRVVYQDLVRITNAIEDGSFFENKALLAAISNAKERRTGLHILSLVSDGGYDAPTDFPLKGRKS
jgi:2,3-bisphosphoglycerate-independent phosphoglycerate mutase